MAWRRSSQGHIFIFLSILGLAMLAGWIWLAGLESLRGPPLLQFLPRYLALFAVYLGAVWGVLKTGTEIPQNTRRQRQLLALVVFLGLGFRLPLLGNPPTLSDDVYRYMWDGKVSLAGINPYTYAVEAPELAGLDDNLRSQVNNPQMASPYLPSAQALFYTLEALTPATTATYQIAMVAIDLTGMICLVLILRQLGRPLGWSLIYFWNPLVVVEFAHGAHIDALMNALMLGGLWLALKRRGGLGSPLMMAAATLVKPLPLLLVPLLAPRWRLRGILTYITGMAAGLLPFSAVGLGIGSDSGTGILGAATQYARYWNFNSGVYHWLEAWLTNNNTPGAADSNDPGVATAKLIVLIGLGVVVIWTGWRSWRLLMKQADGIKAQRAWSGLCLIPLAGYLLLTTTVHPWYVTSLLILLPLWAAGRWGWLRLSPWIYFSAAVALSYLTYLDPANLRETDFTRRWEYYPLLILLLASAVIPGLAAAGEPEAS
jgi:alpha-1,6-mannosyltransferase